jgi:hypothetical protein
MERSDKPARSASSSWLHPQRLRSSRKYAPWSEEDVSLRLDISFIMDIPPALFKEVRSRRRRPHHRVALKLPRYLSLAIFLASYNSVAYRFPFGAAQPTTLAPNAFAGYARQAELTFQVLLGNRPRMQNGKLLASRWNSSYDVIRIV